MPPFLRWWRLAGPFLVEEPLNLSQPKGRKPSSLNSKAWNKEVFGQLKVNIAEAKTKLMDIQTTFDSNPCDCILLDLNSAKVALPNWLNVEPTLWKQREKIR